MAAAKLQSPPADGGVEDIVHRKVDAVWQRLQNFEPLVQKLLRVFDERLTKQEQGLAKLVEQRVSVDEFRICVQRCDLMQQAVGKLAQAHNADMRVALGRLQMLEATAVQATDTPSVDSPAPVTSSDAEDVRAQSGRPPRSMESPVPAMQDRKKKPSVEKLCRVFGDRPDSVAEQLAAGGREGVAQQDLAGSKAQQLETPPLPTTSATGRSRPPSPAALVVADQQAAKLEPVVAVGVVKHAGGVRAKISQLEMLSTMTPKAAAVS